jgi:peptide/nickel transport system ATP-binding protein
MDSDVLLRVEALSVAYSGAVVVRDLDLELHAAERLGVVGETGSGKSTLGYTLLGMLPRGGEVVGGSISFGGRDMLGFTERQWCDIRGREVGLVYQDAGAGLDPVKTVGAQIAEAIRVHATGISRAQTRARVGEALEQVSISASRMHAYPHELSGGMRQRVAIAMALVHRPRLVIADEPTSALDVTTQSNVLRLLEDLVFDIGAALILISHDLGIVAGFCESTLVMYAGRVAEIGPSADMFATPRHPYTAGLLECVTALHDPSLKRLPTIPGMAHQGASALSGCPFEPRCCNPARDERCRVVVPGLSPLGPTRAACLYPLAGAGRRE